MHAHIHKTQYRPTEAEMVEDCLPRLAGFTLLRALYERCSADEVKRVSADAAPTAGDE